MSGRGQAEGIPGASCTDSAAMSEGDVFCADSTLKRQPQGMAAPAGPRAQRFRQAVLHAVREQCVVQLLLFISATSGEWRGGGTAPHGSSSPHSASLAAKLGTDPSQTPSRGIQSPRGAASDRGLRRRRLWRPARACGKRADFGLSSLHIPMWEPAEFCWGP